MLLRLIAENIKDIYELEVINQVVYDDEDSEGKNKKNMKSSPSTARELENEWGEIEQDIFENERDKKNNLLNSIYVEIEKENGDKQYKKVEISKDDANKKEPCIKIKYTVEDKICLNSPGDYSPGDEQNSNFDKETMKDSGIKTGYKTNTNSISNINYSMNSIKKHDNSTLKKENVSEILLKDSKSSQNIFNSLEFDKSNLSGTNTSNQKYQKYPNFKKDFNLVKNKKIDSIKPINYKFEREEEISPIKVIKEKRFYKGINEEKSSNLIDIIDHDEEVQPNKSIEIEEKYFKKEKEDTPTQEKKVEKKQKNFFEENKRQIDEIVKVEKKEAEIEQSNKDFATRFKVKEKEPEKKEIIYDRNKILKEKKMQELEIGKEKEKKSTKSYDEDEATKTKETFKKEVIREKEEIKEVKNIRDKYRNKNKKEENEEPEIISSNLNKNKYSNNKYTNISKELNPSKSEKIILIKKDNFIKPQYKDSSQFKEVKEEINIVKSPVVKVEERESSEKPRKYQKRRFYSGKEEDDKRQKDIIATEKKIETQPKYKYRRFGGKDENNEKEENVDNINVKNQNYRRYFDDKDKDDNRKEIKTEVSTPSKHRYNTFQNKKKLEELKIKEEPDKQIRRWRDKRDVEEDTNIISKKKEEERIRLEYERKEKE